MRLILKELTNNKFKFSIFIFLLFLIIISVARAFYLAQILSFDFHYSPAKLVSEGINHYRYTLDGYRDYGPNDRIMYDQNGVYAQGFFILLIPFTWLNWDSSKFLWSLVNICLAIIIPILLCKKFQLSLSKTFIVLSIFLTSTVFRIHISYGQQTLFCFFFLILPFFKNSNFTSILSGISYFKYNIGYVLFIYFLTLKKINKLLLSLIPCIIGWLSYSLITDTNIIKNLIEPIQTIFFYETKNKLPVTILSFLKEFEVPSMAVILLSIIISVIAIYKLRFRGNDLYKLSIICLVSLSFASHQLHDYILLLPLLILSIKNINNFYSKINLIFIFYFFFFLRILSFFFGFQPWEFPYGYFGYLNNFLTILILFFNLKYLSSVSFSLKKRNKLYD